MQIFERGREDLRGEGLDFFKCNLFDYLYINIYNYIIIKFKKVIIIIKINV